MPEPTDTSPHVRPPRYLTEDVKGIGGRLKERPEDFVVEEAPLYEPSGEGEHVYLLVEKRGVTAIDMVATIARHFRVPRRAVGYAGLKDKQAITRQYVSVHMPGRPIEDVPAFDHPRIAILSATRHGNKLRRGHLAGNRFSIRVRGVDPTAAVAAKRALNTLERLGVPDRVGPQRFGFLSNNHMIGRAMFLRDFDAAVEELLGPARYTQTPEDQAEARDLYVKRDFQAARAAMPKFLRTERVVLEALGAGENPEQAILSIDPGILSYYLSAFQSAVFNAALEDRIERGLLGTLLEGDVAMRHKGRKLFDVDDVILAQDDTAERLQTIEISPTGPMWGSTMREASGVPGESDRAALASFGVRPEDFARAEELGAEMTRGDRRPYRVPIRDIEVEGGTDDHGVYVRCAFDLPRGAFATTVMDEVMKNVPDAGRDDDGENDSER
ncbi:MAG: tRNA pseudouridine(13) synthase TruD [Phycisphaerae bacterium]|nr:tRNA pseudouridine(13) synthase TruD [Phycisphaerae bacterium]